MKKKTKRETKGIKLKVKAETVRKMSTDQLGQAAGGRGVGFDTCDAGMSCRPGLA